MTEQAKGNCCLQSFVRSVSIIACFFLPRIWLQSENTVKEIRNTFSMRGLCSLMSHGTFRSAVQGHLAVGHTHEDVDAIFSLCATALKSSPGLLQTPRDIQRVLEERLTPMFAKRGQHFAIEILGVETHLYIINHIFCLLYFNVSLCSFPARFLQSHLKKLGG